MSLKTIEINGRQIKYYPSRITYVYCLFCPITQQPFYVGRTQNPDLTVRLKQHCSRGNKNTDLAERIENIRQQGMHPEIKLILASDFLQHETEIIAEYSAKYKLLNRFPLREHLKKLCKDLQEQWQLNP